jgi:hypothetical protein
MRDQMILDRIRNDSLFLDQTLLVFFLGHIFLWLWNFFFEKIF